MSSSGSVPDSVIDLAVCLATSTVWAVATGLSLTVVILMVTVFELSSPETRVFSTSPTEKYELNSW